MKEIKNQTFRHKKSGLLYVLGNVVINMDGTTHHLTQYLSGFQLKDGKLYGRCRDFYPEQVEEVCKGIEEK